MNKRLKRKILITFAWNSLFIFIALCIFSGLFLLLITNEDCVGAVQALAEHDTSIFLVWAILIPAYVLVAVLGGLGFAFFSVGMAEEERKAEAKRVTHRKTTTKKRKK